MTKVIVGLGDSTTAGTPFFLSPLEAPPSGRGIPESQYSYWMMKERPDWTVLNRGINGQRSDQILSRFERDVVAARPSVVILLAGVNDIYQGRSLESVKKNLDAMYALAGARGIVPVAASVLPYDSAARTKAEAIRRLNSWIESASRAEKRLFCDTNLAVRDPNDSDRLASSPDGLHPDVEGYRRMGMALTRTLVSAGF